MRSRPNLWICVILVLTTAAVYAPASRFDFVNFDDPDYVSANEHVRNGLSWDSITWAFTSTEAANWFPLTRLSHLLDAELYGISGGPHHLTSVIIHILATLLLFAFLLRATGARRPSAFVAFLFALHPLHVESVAWISERKDVLCAFFWFLALWAYAARRMWLVAVAFCLGLLCKPMIVTLPFLLLLLDVWPLKRLSKQAVLEKIPLFAIAAIAAAVTFAVQSGGGAVRTVETFPLGLRIANALVSYTIYIRDMLWPHALAAFYPYPSGIPLWEIGLSAAVLISITAGALTALRPRPYLAVGWFWYLGTLTPVIGLVQVGAQSRADRYTYVPMIGLTIMLAWGAADLLRKWPRALTATAVGICFSSAALTAMQLQYWRNSETLFRHALDSTSGNYLAHHNLGVAIAVDPNRSAEAIAQYREALRIKPDSARVHSDLGTALVQDPSRLAEAVAEYREAIRIAPDEPIPHNNLANTLAMTSGGLPAAIAEYETALRLQPRYSAARSGLAEAHYNLGVELAKAGRVPEAIAHLEAALQWKPGFAEAHNNLGVVLSGIRGREAEALGNFAAAVKAKPDYADARVNLGVALSQAGRTAEAIDQLGAAMRLRPDPQVADMLRQLRRASSNR